MRLTSRALARFSLLILFEFLTGCGSFGPAIPSSNLGSFPQVTLSCGPSTEPDSHGDIVLVSLKSDPEAQAKTKNDASPFVGKAELSLDALIEQVLARNPSLMEMVAAQQAASARYPQVTSLEDPMFATTIGPETFSPDDAGVEFAYRLEISQKYPWPGKRQMRGQNATAAANAAGNDVDDMRLQLIESARNAFYDYYLAERALEVNQQSLDLLTRIRQDAQIRYESGKLKVSIQEVYQFKVEIGREQQRRLNLERMREVAKARINTLMHQTPDQPLPAPPKELKVEVESHSVQELRQAGLARRPDLQAVRNRVAAEEATLELAYKEFYPDFEPFFSYDRFMGNTSGGRDLASMLGVRLNLPIRRARRNAAVEEAQANLAQRRAELDKLTDQASFQIDQAYQEVREAGATVRLYESTILKDADDNVKAAQPAYRDGQIPASNLLEAERALVTLKDRYFEAIADFHRRQATLERATGGLPEGGPLPPVAPQPRN